MPRLDPNALTFGTFTSSYPPVEGVIPSAQALERVLELCRQVPREMVRNALYWGTPDDVAPRIIAEVEAGARHFALCTYVGFISRADGRLRPRRAGVAASNTRRVAIVNSLTSGRFRLSRGAARLTACWWCGGGGSWPCGCSSWRRRHRRPRSD